MYKIKFGSKIILVITIYLILLLAITNSKAECIQQVEYCNLIENPSLYMDKIIKLHGIYYVGGDDSKFFSTECTNDIKVFVEFDSIFNICTENKYIKLMKELKKKSKSYFARKHSSTITIPYQKAEVVFSGVLRKSEFYKQHKVTNENNKDSFLFDEYDLKSFYEYIFTVQCAEKINTIK